MGFGNLFKKRKAEFTKEDIEYVDGIVVYCSRLYSDPKIRSRMQAAGLTDGLTGVSAGKWASLKARMGDPNALSSSDYGYIKKLIDFGLGECAVRMKWLAPMLSMPDSAEQYRKLSQLDTQGKKLLEKLWFV